MIKKPCISFAIRILSRLKYAAFSADVCPLLVLLEGDFLALIFASLSFASSERGYSCDKFICLYSVPYRNVNAKSGNNYNAEQIPFDAQADRV